MKCPVCNCELIVVERQRVELDYCISCRGLWFDSGELEHLFEIYSIDASLLDISTVQPIETPEKKRLCPRCDKKMDKVTIGDAPGVIADRCPSGEGIWLDKGELGAIMDEKGDQDHSKILKFLGETFNA